MRNEVLARLREDHERFERLFVEIEKQCAAKEEGHAADELCLRAIVKYLAEFSLCLHHVLEDAIFVRLLKILPCFLEVYDLTDDHRDCQREFEAFASAAIPVGDNFVEMARSYVGNERAHFIAEEEIFFPYAERFLDDEQWQGINDCMITDKSRSAQPQDPTIARILQAV